MDNNYFEVSEQDFVVRIRPTSVGNEWTGEVDIAIITSAQNDLNDESYHQLMHFAKMMCATVPLMEGDENLRDYVHDYVMSELDNLIEDVEEPTEVSVTQEDGNVFRLSFGTKAKGNA